MCVDGDKLFVTVTPRSRFWVTCVNTLLSVFKLTGILEFPILSTQHLLTDIEQTKFRLLNSNLTVGNSKSWPRGLNLVAQGDLSLVVYK